MFGWWKRHSQKPQVSGSSSSLTITATLSMLENVKQARDVGTARAVATGHIAGAAWWVAHNYGSDAAHDLLWNIAKAIEEEWKGTGDSLLDEGGKVLKTFVDFE